MTPHPSRAATCKNAVNVAPCIATRSAASRTNPPLSARAARTERGAGMYAAQAGAGRAIMPRCAIALQGANDVNRQGHPNSRLDRWRGAIPLCAVADGGGNRS